MRHLTLTLVAAILIVVGASCDDDSSANNASAGGAGNQVDNGETVLPSSAAALDQHAPLNDRQAPLNDRQAPLNDRQAPLNDRQAPLNDRQESVVVSASGEVVGQDCLSLCSKPASLGCEVETEYCTALCLLIATRVCQPEATRLLTCSATAASCDALENCDDEFNAFVDCAGGDQVNGASEVDDSSR